MPPVISDRVASQPIPRQLAPSPSRYRWGSKLITKSQGFSVKDREIVHIWSTVSIWDVWSFQAGLFPLAFAGGRSEAVCKIWYVAFGTLSLATQQGICCNMTPTGGDERWHWCRFFAVLPSCLGKTARASVGFERIENGIPKRHPVRPYDFMVRVRHLDIVDINLKGLTYNRTKIRTAFFVGVPSSKLTYPLLKAFWRWFSFSPGGIS